MGVPYIPFQPRTLDELAQSAQSFDPGPPGGPGNLARMLMPDMGNVAMPETPQQARRGKANVFKQILGDFLYSYGQGLAAGGGARGTGVALLAPMLRRQQQEEDERQEAIAAQERAQEQRRQQFEGMNIWSQILERAGRMGEPESPLVVGPGLLYDRESRRFIQGPQTERPQHIGGGYLLYPDGRIEKAGPEEQPQPTEAILKSELAKLEAKRERTPEEEAKRQALRTVLGVEKEPTTAAPTVIIGNRRKQWNRETQRYDIDAGPAPSRGREQEASLSPAEARALRGQLLSEARAIKSDFTDLRFELPVDRIMEMLAEESGYSLAEINRLAFPEQQGQRQTPTPGAAPLPGETKVYQGYEYRFSGREWIRGKRVQ